MSIPAPVEVVRRIFEARAAGDVRRLRGLMDPDVRDSFGDREGRRVEVDAHRIEPLDDEHVRVHGRIRVIERGTLTDSPAGWLFTVRGGRAVEIVALDATRPGMRARPRLRRVA